MTASELMWFSDGLRELERLLAAGEDDIARELAAFIDNRIGGHAATSRLVDHRVFERAS